MGCSSYQLWPSLLTAARTRVAHSVVRPQARLIAICAARWPFPTALGWGSRQPEDCASGGERHDCLYLSLSQTPLPADTLVHGMLVPASAMPPYRLPRPPPPPHTQTQTHSHTSPAPPGVRGAGALTLLHYLVTWAALWALKTAGVFVASDAPMNRQLWALAVVVGITPCVNNM